MTAVKISTPEECMCSFWEMLMSYHESEEKYKDGISWPAFPESTSVDYRCVPDLKPGWTKSLKIWTQILQNLHRNLMRCA